MSDGSLIGALLGSIGLGLISPVNIVTGLVIGWFLRRWWQILVAVIVLQAIELAVFTATKLEPDQQILWAALPVGLVAPLAWCAAGRLLRTLLYQPDGTARHGVGVRTGWTVIGVVLGGIAGGVIGFAAGIAYVQIAKVSTFEGLAGYMAVFGFGLPGVVIGLVAGGILAWRLSGRIKRPVSGLPKG